jgi:hypothetical protein
MLKDTLVKTVKVTQNRKINNSEDAIEAQRLDKVLRTICSKYGIDIIGIYREAMRC